MNTTPDEAKIKSVLAQVYDALCQRGYNPINQLVGYLLSDDPTYIPNFNNARSIIRRVERDDILTLILEKYLEKYLKKNNESE